MCITNTENVKEWLANYFKTTDSRVNEMLKDELATTYLLVWPIFEQKLFNGYMQKKNISAVATQYSVYAQELNIEPAAMHFHNRYQNTTNYRHLKHKDNDPAVDGILGKQYATLSDTEKLHLVIYTVYRYRNNIFHGNKGIESWSHFKQEIGLCLDFMTSMLDCAENHSQNGGTV